MSRFNFATLFHRMYGDNLEIELSCILQAADAAVKFLFSMLMVLLN